MPIKKAPHSGALLTLNPYRSLLQVALLLKLFYGSHVISIQNKYLQQMNNIEYQAQLVAGKIIQKYFH